MTTARTEVLSKRYGDTPALAGLDLVASPARCTGTSGPNGAGKTTTIRPLLGLHRPTSGRAELLIIDEPSAGLDPPMEMAFRETVREAEARGQTDFLSSHILSEVEAVCDRVGILRAGRLVDEGTGRAPRRRSQLFRSAAWSRRAPTACPRQSSSSPPRRSPSRCCRARASASATG